EQLARKSIESFDASSVVPQRGSLQHGPRPVKFFVSASDEDRAESERLLKLLTDHLQTSDVYEHQLWSDAEILPGEIRPAEIAKALSSSDIGLLLLSP